MAERKVYKFSAVQAYLTFHSPPVSGAMIPSDVTHSMIYRGEPAKVTAIVYIKSQKGAKHGKVRSR